MTSQPSLRGACDEAILLKTGLPRPDASGLAMTGEERAAANWSRRVDLPIPGSPPNKIKLPGTSPPPKTRSTSPMPVVILSTSCPWILEKSTTSEAGTVFLLVIGNL